MGDVIPMQWAKTKTNDPESRDNNGVSDVYSAHEETVDLNKGPMPTDKLYPRMPKFNPAGVFTKELFDESIGLLDLAREALEQNDIISSDCNVQALPALLKRIFLIRSDGEGIRLLVSSVFNAIRNKNGMPLNLEEIAAIRLTLYRGRQLPFLSFDESLSYIEDHIESIGMDTDPDTARQIEEWLNV